MECIDENRLLEFMSGALPEEVAREVEEHLDTCSSCHDLVTAVARARVVPAREVPTSSGSGSDSIGPGELLVPGTKIARYIVLRCIGSGGMGRVYAAHDPELDRRVAIKLLRGEQEWGGSPSAYLLREAQALARLSHPNVIGVHDVGTAHGRVFIAMEFAEGVTLKAWLAAVPRSVREIQHVFFLAGQGLAAAHAAGLVHRDFKPDNVLVGADGRVRVLDFGFARQAHPAHEAPAVVAPSAIPVGETSVSGVLAGTPAYMAPEQRAGQATSARSDQYSFCVALWEALDGARPHPEPETSAPPRRGSAALHKVLRRGLSADPDKRHDSMADLLDHISPERAARKRWLVLGAAAVVLIGGFISYATSTARASTCRGAERRLDGVWDAARKESMRARFLSLGRPYAEDAVRGTSEILDRFAGAWVDMHTQACEATRRGEQSEELLDLRMSCLASRLEGLRATADALVTADGEVLDHAVQMASGMPHLDACADTARLRDVARRPTEPAQAAAVELMSRQVAEVRVLHAAGKYTAALAMLRSLMERIHALHYDPLESEALYLRGECLVELGDTKAAAQDLFDAALAAERGRDQRALVPARYGLAWVLRMQARPDEAMQWLSLAQAGLGNFGNDDWIEAKLLLVRVMVLSDLGRWAEARRDGERALELFQDPGEPNLRGAGYALLNLGVVAHDEGKLEEALDYYTRAYEQLVRALGDKHPSVTQPMLNIARALYDMKRRDEAPKWWERALKLRRDVLGLEDRQVANIYLDMATYARTGGDLGEATRLALESLRIMKRVLGKNHPLVATPLIELGYIYLARKEPLRAIEVLEEALLLPPRKLASKPDVKFPLGCALWEAARGRAGSGNRTRGLRLIAEADESYTGKNTPHAVLREEIRAWRALHPEAVLKPVQ